MRVGGVRILLLCTVPRLMNRAWGAGCVIPSMIPCPAALGGYRRTGVVLIASAGFVLDHEALCP